MDADSKVKLLVITSTFPRWPDDSVPPFVFELCKSLQRDFCLTVLAPHFPGAATRERWDNMDIRRFRYFWPPLEKLALGDGIMSTLRKNILYYLLVPFFLVGELIAIKRTLRDIKPDLIHAHWLIPQGLLAALVNANRPLIISTHGGDIWSLRNPLMMALKRFALGRARAATVVSHEIKKDIERNLLPDLNPSVISMGVDAKSFSPDNFSDEWRAQYSAYDNVLLYVGRLSETKGVDYLIQALPGVMRHHPRTKLVIVGSGPLENSLRQMITDLNIGDHVDLLGPKPNTELPHYYASADIFVAPFIEASGGVREGLPVTLMEAMAAGAVVVTSDLTGNRDLVKDGHNGFICRQKDAEDLAKKIVYGLDTDSRATIKSAARQTILENFDWSVIGIKYADLLKKQLYETSQ